MKQTLWVLLALYVSTMTIACSKSSGGGDPVVGVVNPYGIYTGTNTNLAYFSDNWSDQRSITITDKTAFREFLRTSMGVCDRTSGYNGGTASCTTWISGGLDIVLTMPDPNSNQLAVTFRAWPQMNAYYNYSYSIPALQSWFSGVSGLTAGAYYNPLALGNFTVSPVNNSAGFEARSYGPLYGYGNRSLIQVRVDTGHLGDDSFTFKLGYPNCVQDSSKSCSSPTGVWFATGTFKRCQSPTCAVAGGAW